MKRLFPVLLLFFSGCSIFSPYSSEFSCPGYRPGVCASIPDVYRMYKRGAFLNVSDTDNETKEFTYKPLKCGAKTVCEECGDPFIGEKKCCERIKRCVPDNVSKHIDYRAEAVRDNACREKVVW